MEITQLSHFFGEKISSWVNEQVFHAINYFHSLTHMRSFGTSLGF